jgi:hypothetical protein
MIQALLHKAIVLPRDASSNAASLQKWTVDSFTLFRNFGVDGPQTSRDYRHTLELIGREHDPLRSNQLVDALCKAVGARKTDISAAVKAAMRGRRRAQLSKKPTQVFEWQGQEYETPSRLCGNDKKIYRGLTNFLETIDNKGDVTQEALTTLAIAAAVFHRIGEETIINVGEEFIYHDGRTLVSIAYHAELFSVLAEHYVQPTDWETGPRYVTASQFFATTRRHAPSYVRACDHPEFPRRADTFYYGDASIELPMSTQQSFTTLLDYFCPATDLDRHLIGALFASMLWSGWETPLFQIEARTGRNSGKSTLARSAPSIIDQTPLDVSEAERRDVERLKRRLVAGAGRRAGVLLCDNVENRFESPGIAALITSRWVSAMPNFGRHECRRPNDFVIICTMNDAVSDPDLADRAFLIHLRRPDVFDPDWESSLDDFIESNRRQLWADIIALLSTSPKWRPARKRTRFAPFETEVLAAVTPDQRTFDAILELTVSRQQESDTDADLAAEVGGVINEFVDEVCRSKGLDVTTAVIGLANPVLRQLYIRASGHTNVHVQRVSKFFVREISDHKLPRLSPPLNGRLDCRTRGLIWRGISAEPAADVDAVVRDSDAFVKGLLKGLHVAATSEDSAAFGMEGTQQQQDTQSGAGTQDDAKDSNYDSVSDLLS